MKPMLAVVRAIGAEFIRRMLRPIVISGLLMAVVLLGFGAWLTTQSPWWWFLEFVFICGSLLFGVLVVAARVLINTAAPEQTKAQKHAVSSFVDKLERVAENLKTPQFVILYRVVRDMIFPRSTSFIATVSNDSKTLAPDFNKLRKQFE